MQGRTGEANDMEKEAADDNNGRTEPVDPTIEQLKRIEAWLNQIINFSTGQQYRLDQSKDYQLKNHAEAINDNLGYLDPETAAYLRRIPKNKREREIRKMLGSQNVVTGVDRNTASLAAKAMGMVLTDMSSGEAFSVGGYIFVLGNTQEYDALLGHEAIHGIQSIAAGGTVNFLNNYNQACIDSGRTTQPVNNQNIISYGSHAIDIEKAYYGNRYEQAAYSFGPKNRDAQRYLPNGRKQLIW